MTKTLQDRIIENYRKQFIYDKKGTETGGIFIEDAEELGQFLIKSIKEVQEETRKEILGEISYAIRNSYMEVQAPTGNFEVLDPKFLNEQLLSITNKEK